MDLSERNAHKDLKHKSACMIPSKLKAHIMACMTKICARDGTIAIPWSMEAKACIFAMDEY